VSTFNRGVAEDITVERRDDRILLRFGEDTLGVNPTSDGFTVTPDWNDRRFTLAIPENSVLYHLTEEVEEKKVGNEGNIPPESFIAEIYGAVRSIAPLYPIRDLLEDSADEEVGRASFDALKDYLIDKGIVNITATGVEVKDERKRELESSYTNNETVREEVHEAVLSPIPATEMVDSDEAVFVATDEDSFPILIFLFPDEYVAITSPTDLFFAVEQMTNARSIDLLMQALAP